MINITSNGLVVVGTIVGRVTLNPVILGTISDAGLLLKTFSKSRITKKIESLNLHAYTYQKRLTDLRASLRGAEFIHNQFINEMRLMDETIIDLCPLADKFEMCMTKKSNPSKLLE